jgi:hypothetical protein
LLPTVGVGIGLTVTLVVIPATHPFTSVTLNVYTPLFDTEAEATVGFWELELNEAGPLHV